MRVWEVLAEKGDVMQYIVSVFFFFKKGIFELQNPSHCENTIVLKLMCT